jgi:hypothetical protein
MFSLTVMFRQTFSIIIISSAFNVTPGCDKIPLNRTLVYISSEGMGNWRQLRLDEGEGSAPIINGADQSAAWGEFRKPSPEINTCKYTNYNTETGERNTPTTKNANIQFAIIKTNASPVSKPVIKRRQRHSQSPSHKRSIHYILVQSEPTA